MNDTAFPRRFTQALRPGTYLRFVVEGDLGVGDEIHVIERPNHDLTIRDVLRIYAFDREEAGRLLAVPGMSESWQKWAEQYLRQIEGRDAETSGERRS